VTAKRYSRRQAIGLGAGTFAALYLAACGGGGGTSGGASGEPTATTSVDVLYDWTYNGPPGKVAEFWRQARAKLAQTNGNARIGQLTEVPFESLYQTVPAAIQAKSGPSIATWYADYATFRLSSAGDIAPVSDLVAASEPPHWLLASTVNNGKYYGAPMVLEIAVLVINRKLFDKAGISLETQFASYAAFTDACDRLKSAGITPIQAGTSDGVGAEKWAQFEQLQVCETPADLLRGVIGEVSVDAPVFARPRDQIPVLRDKYMNPKVHQDTDQMSIDKFLGGSAGMAIAYTSQVLGAKTTPEFEVIGFPKAAAKFNRPAIGTGDPLIVMDYADNKAAAAEVIQFLHEPEQLNLWWSLTGSFPGDDRFDASQLPAQGKRIWDFAVAQPGDPYSLWWPDNYYPPSVALPYIGIEQDQFAGASTPAQARDKTDQLFKQFRDGSPQEVEVVKEYIAVLPQ